MPRSAHRSTPSSTSAAASSASTSRRSAPPSTRLTGRRVKTFLSANHVGDRIAAEVFFLEAAPAATT
jgi:hypothetical protein